MRRPAHSRRFAALALLAIGGAVGLVGATDRGDQSLGGRMGLQHSPERLAELRTRWESFSESERDLMRRRLGELKKLSAEKQRMVSERAKRLDQMARTIYRSLEPDVRARLDRLGPTKKRELLREIVVAETREFGARVLDRIPAEDRERLKTASDQDRVEYFVELRRHMGERIDGTIAKMAPELGFSQQEIERLSALPRDDARMQFLKMVKRRSENIVNTMGLPTGFPPERWEELKSFRPDEFYVAMLRLRRQYPDLGLWRRGHMNGERKSIERLKQAMMHDLDAEERLELSTLSREERMEEMRNRRRERVVKVIREEQLLPPDKIERLESSPDKAFLKVVRELVSGGRNAPSNADRRPPWQRQRPGGPPPMKRDG